MSFLINPSDVIDYDRSDHDLELFWLFSLVVAGKTATTQARLLNNFLTALPSADYSENDTPFERIHKSEARGELLDALIASRLGQYNRLYKAMTQSLSLDLCRCSVDDLEAIHGVGPKTARMFIMMSRRDQRYAALDTHILKHLRENGFEAPLATPPAGSRYRDLENHFLTLADVSGMGVAEYDLMIWKKYSAISNA